MVNDYHGFSLLLCSSRKTISSPFYKKESIIMLILRRYYIDLKKKRVKSIQRINIDTAFFYYVITGIVRNTPIQNSQKI
jgi:hypothetical protein